LGGNLCYADEGTVEQQQLRFVDAQPRQIRKRRGADGFAEAAAEIIRVKPGAPDGLGQIEIRVLDVFVKRALERLGEGTSGGTCTSADG
jgi:hypothetical protein